MNEIEASRLRLLLRQAPDNILLRIGLVRRLIALGEETEALALALELDLGQVKTASDRVILGGLFRRAGLVAMATQLDDNLVSMLDDLPQIETTEPAKGEQMLRVVGGQDASPGKIEAAGSAPLDTLPTFADVAGLDAAKNRLNRRVILPLTNPALVGKYRKRRGGGVLIYGPPGNGKTLLARAVAGESGAGLIGARLPDILNSTSSGPRKRLAYLFEKAREHPPALVFFDELDALSARPAPNAPSQFPHLEAHLLAALDDLAARNDRTVVLASSSAPWTLGLAFLRPGRFDQFVFVTPPDKTARQRILALELADLPIGDDVDTDALAAATAGFSGRDLRSVVERAADAAIDATLDSGRAMPIAQAMLRSAAGRTRLTLDSWIKLARANARLWRGDSRFDDLANYLTSRETET